MKNLTSCCIILSLLIVVSCAEKKEEIENSIKSKPMVVLPFQKMALSDLADFETGPTNWKITGGINSDRSKEEFIETTEGTGILVNTYAKDNSENLFSTFEHGDIEIEFDVMLPKGSNSGIYFQSRYELQLFDSWGELEPKHGDMGGIYERWDKTNDEGSLGFDGHAPKVNASKAPGLWQHLKVVFHAPKFDESGSKIKNAWFEEVWLNGALLHKNVELTGPTRAASFENEQAMGRLMIQGDHGAVALKNIQYKLYEEKSIGFQNIVLQEYDNAEKLFPDVNSMEVVEQTEVDEIDLTEIAKSNSQKLFKYSGSMAIPSSGDYLFNISLNGGAALLIKKDTVISMNGSYNRDSLGLGKVFLEKGEVPFTLIYNKHTPWERGFDIYAEGPGIQKYSLQKIIPKAEQQKDQQDFSIKVKDELVTQRSFWMHEGEKRTHCISIGMPQRINYTYDLEAGSLLQVWGGDFMDATKMWLSRGEKQLGEPDGFIVSLHGDPEITSLDNDNAPWPNNSIKNEKFKQRGYEFDNNGLPIFNCQINESSVSYKMIPSPTERAIKRMILIDGPNEVWHKLAEGEQIKEFSDGSFIVNDESYYIEFSENSSVKPIIRNRNGKDELLVKIPAGKQNINYTIIW